MMLANAFFLFNIAAATIVLLVELRRGSSTLRAVVTSGAVAVFSVLGLVGYIVFRAVEQRNRFS
ncbi:hypothetical protein C1Y63_07040 [Corynebacterium sp. 13CS0277]|uniref:hypothetical protein n=1 Tax=Corynebacterium sp. 13CS0277 TaxID=2071994 RepID=UPI000D024EE4|nr:hypothetical protein [Corynebacterium sp. 13CS0277]PRQ11300.1 hypothetical protein C1Y63_07040 [Corynebacterium sp. 13CS0277]